MNPPGFVPFRYRHKTGRKCIKAFPYALGGISSLVSDGKPWTRQVPCTGSSWDSGEARRGQRKTEAGTFHNDGEFVFLVLSFAAALALV